MLANSLKRAAEEYEAEIEKHEQEKYQRIKNYVDSLSSEEIRSQLIYALLEKEDEFDKMHGYYVDSYEDWR